ncbi:MAG: Hpt domain-containing protein [Salibacteraceae bacterium]
MSKKLYDLSILSEMVYGDTDFMKELVDTFIEYAPVDTGELKEFALKQNWEETSKKAHKLKSSIRTIGVTSLSDLILEIEIDAKELKEIELINKKIDQFSQTLDLVLDQLKNEKF